MPANWLWKIPEMVLILIMRLQGTALLKQVLYTKGKIRKKKDTPKSQRYRMRKQDFPKGTKCDKGITFGHKISTQGAHSFSPEKCAQLTPIADSTIPLSAPVFEGGKNTAVYDELHRGTVIGEDNECEAMSGAQTM